MGMAAPSRAFFTFISMYNKIVYAVKETPYFQQQAAKIWSDVEREEFIGWIAENPLAGDVIPEAAPLRKVRWGRQGMGKSGGARVIYFNQLDDGLVILATAYAKSVDDNLSAAFLRRLAKLLES